LERSIQVIRFFSGMILAIPAEGIDPNHTLPLAKLVPEVSKAGRASTSISLVYEK
jgi:hypothetical protein